MEALKVILTILYILVCVAIVLVVLMQDSKSEGLSAAIAGGATSGSYWSKNKGRSKEGMLSKATIILTVLFIVLSVVLNLSVFKGL